MRYVENLSYTSGGYYRELVVDHAVVISHSAHGMLSTLKGS